MRVRTKTGREIHLHDDVLCALLDAGIVERVVDPAAPPAPELSYQPAAVWRVELSANGNYAVIVVSCAGCGGRETLHSVGAPSWAWSHCRGHRDPIPPEIRKEFFEVEERVHA
jgi:hypothetical protein